MQKKLPEIWGFRFFLNSKKIGALLVKILLLLIIPYAFLMLCGLVFDYWLRWYFMTNFIFVSLIVLYLIAFTLIVWAVARYINNSKKR
jgi:hypothetical protein